MAGFVESWSVHISPTFTKEPGTPGKSRVVALLGPDPEGVHVFYRFTHVCAVQYSSVKQMFINISSHFHCQYLQMACVYHSLGYVLHVFGKHFRISLLGKGKELIVKMSVKMV